MQFLTILNHADKGHDDQKVDVFHHFHIHGVCVRVEAESVSETVLSAGVFVSSASVGYKPGLSYTSCYENVALD